MSYACYLGGVEMPVTPSKLTVKTKNKNKTLVLLNEGEINFLRTPGLSEITLPLTFPMFGGKPPDYYLSFLEALKAAKKPTRFKLVRSAPNGSLLFDTDMRVSVEDYSITENAKEGLDVSVDIDLKQWQDYGTKTGVVAETAPGIPASVSVEVERDASSAPATDTYTVQRGDTLWAIAKKYYGNGAEYAKIYSANPDKISNPNFIQAGQVLTIL